MKIIIDDKKNADRGWRGLRAKAAALSAKEFTLALTPHKSLRSALMLYLAGIPTRVGFRQSRGWFLFNQHVLRDATRHDVERNLSILEAFDVRPEQCQREIVLPVRPDVQIQVDEKLDALGILADKPLVGINPGSVWPTKRWSTDGFAQLISILRQKLDCQVVLFGAVEDAAVVNSIIECCRGAATSLVGQISLRQLPAAIGRCKVFVSNDSGPMHIAVARRVPTVAVFCATTPALGFYPYSEHAIVVEKQLSCRPCTSHGGRRCPLASEACIRLIEPETVFQAVEKLFLRTSHRIDAPIADFLSAFVSA
jgi:heptosyltransferase-2